MIVGSARAIKDLKTSLAVEILYRTAIHSITYTNNQSFSRPLPIFLCTVILTETGGLSSGEVTAITVPIVLLLVIALLLLGLLWYYRKYKKPPRLHRAPTGLQRLADHLDDPNNYRGNLSNVSSSPYANGYDR